MKSQTLVPKPHTYPQVRSEGVPSSVVYAATRSVQSMPVADGREIFGQCVAYNEISADVGGYSVVFGPRCFRDCVNDPDFDPRILFQHDYSKVLGRKSAGTAAVTEDWQGVSFDVVVPACSWALDLLASMERDDINGADVGFVTQQSHWEFRDGQKVKIIDQATLMEISVASWPVFEKTTAEVTRGRLNLERAYLSYLAGPPRLM